MKCYLLSNKCLQLTGSPSYFSFCSQNHQVLNVNDSIDWEVNALIKNIYHRQATTEIVIEKSGIYDLFADIITHEPSQITLFINGVPDLSTVSGRDSGGNRIILRHFVALSKGDVVTVRNYASSAVSINTGGTETGRPALFMGFLLSPLDDECNKSCRHHK